MIVIIPSGICKHHAKPKPDALSESHKQPENDKYLQVTDKLELMDSRQYQLLKT